MLQLPLHIMRAFSSVAGPEISSPAERRYLLDTVHMSAKEIVNVVVWRRSMMAFMIIISLAALGFQGFALRGSIEAYKEASTPDRANRCSCVPCVVVPQLVQTAETNVTYGAVMNDTLSFQFYTKRTAETAVSAAILRVRMAQCFCEAVALVAAFIALVLCVAALYTWSTYRISRRLLLAAWILSFASPFAVSAIPSRTLVCSLVPQHWSTALYYSNTTQQAMVAHSVQVSWDSFDGHRDAFLAGFAAHFQLDQRATQALGACAELQSDQADVTLQGARDSISKLCGVISKCDNGFFNFFTGDACKRAAQKCSACSAMVRDGRVDEALATSREVCTDFQDAVEKTQSGSAKDLQYVAVAADLVDKAQLGAELAIGLVNGLWAFKTMLPSAVAVAPAMLRGALKVKVLVPQSSIPGMFVVMLPWLYCPLLWCVYNLAFHMIGTLYLFFGLMLHAFAPMMYFLVGSVMGVTRHGLPAPHGCSCLAVLHGPPGDLFLWQNTVGVCCRPMDDPTVARVMQVMQYSASLLGVVALSFFGVFAFHQKNEHPGTGLHMTCAQAACGTLTLHPRERTIKRANARWGPESPSCGVGASTR
jgi:hypothetical protein